MVGKNGKQREKGKWGKNEMGTKRKGAQKEMGNGNGYKMKWKWRKMEMGTKRNGKE